MDEITLRVSTCTRDPNPATGEPTFYASNGRDITGWTSLRLTRGLERMPSDFEVSFTEAYPGASDVAVQAGDLVQVILGSDVVLTGFIDALVPSYNARSHAIRITGRSLSQDLVDCSADYPGGQMLNMPADKIAANLCAPYGISVVVAAGTSVGAPVEQVNVFAGQTPYELIELVCRYRALLFYDQPDGSVILASGGGSPNDSSSSPIGVRVASSGFKEGINVSSASVAYRMDCRFSDYDALYQGLDTLKDFGNGGNLHMKVTDVGVPRFRRRVIVSENVAGGVTVAKQRAMWEMASRIGRSMQVSLSTDSWRDSSGALYEPNVLVDVDLPTLKLPPKHWLISNVTYVRDEQGTRADLVIMPPQAFYQEPIVLFPLSPDYTNVSGVNS